MVEEGWRVLARGRNVGGVEGTVVRLTLPQCDGEEDRERLLKPRAQLRASTECGQRKCKWVVGRLRREIDGVWAGWKSRTSTIRSRAERVGRSVDVL